MATWRLFSGACAEWIPNTAYGLGARCVCRSTFATAARRKWVWECTTAGTSHATTEPTWPDGPVGQTVSDNTVVWTCRLSNDGDWLNAHCYMHWLTGYGGLAAGDLIYVHKTHNENKSWAGNQVIYGSNDFLNPIRTYCVDKDNSDALSVGAVVLNGQNGYGPYLVRHMYSYGVQYKATGVGAITLGNASNVGSWILESDGTVTVLYGGYINSYGGPSPNSLRIINADIYVASGTYAGITASGPLLFEWKKGILQQPTPCVTNYLFNFQDAFIGRLEEVDLSQMSQHSGTFNLMAVAADSIWDILLSRCKLPSSHFAWSPGDWTKSLIGGLIAHHCSSANQYYDFHEFNSMGSVEDETTIVRTGGASDGTTPQSWKMVSTAYPIDNLLPLESPPIHIWGDYAVEKTFTIEGIWDSATNIQNDEIWMEFEYPADASSGLGAVSRIKCVPLGTPVDVAASTVAWTTTGMTNPNKFKFVATVTPGKKGPVTARIYLAKPSTTVYIDPKITVS